MADQTKVELVYPDLFVPKLLSGVPFAPAQIRGTVLGILGRLQNEPAIGERQPRLPGDGIKGYKEGVSPSERLDALKRLWRWINPHRNHAEITPLMTAIEAAQQEQSRLEAAKAAPVVVPPVVQEKASVMLDKPEPASIVEAVAETVPESFEALIDARTECPPVTPPHNAQETACAFCGVPCEGEGCTEIDGQMVCASCSKEWGN